MTITKVALVSFSPTNTTKSVLTAIAEGTKLPFYHIDMTLPENRNTTYQTGKDELLLIGFPVYSGRLPQIHPTIFSRLAGKARFVVPVVVYGNRAYDDALIELVLTCVEQKLTPIAAAAFIGEHSYSSELGSNRPDSKDASTAREFGNSILEVLHKKKRLDPSSIPGNTPYRDYPPKLQVTPETTDQCTQCGQCAASCPMGAIDATDFAAIDHTCIMCAACVKKCPVNAKIITFAPLLARMKMIVDTNKEPKQAEVFLPK